MLSQPRSHDTGRGMFFGDLAYERVLQRHANHFWAAVERLIDWEPAVGWGVRPTTVLVFKILFLSYLYNVSERAVEELVDVSLLAKWFLGLAVDETPPDHSTLTAFKARLLEGDNRLILQRIFDNVILTAQEHGLQFGELQLLDSVHTRPM